jgi:sialic acid synthase SpsE
MDVLKFKIGKKIISNTSKTYFIADIAANHDGNLSRALKLIKLAAAAGADAAKFQHFKAETIVSDRGFKNLGKKISHQAKWKKSVFEVYKKASIDFNWTKILKTQCKKYKIEFITAPYDLEYVDKVNKFIPAYKIGSGDITWIEIIKKIAKKKKPVIIATGASSLNDVKRAVKIILKYNKKIVLMQCNTNYTAEDANTNYLNLNVLNQYKKIFGNKVILGLSDHTHGNNSVLGSVALGARVVEKHFTDNNHRTGPDHLFSMNPKTWKKMIKQTRILEKSLGDGKKRIEINEKLSSIVQRRSIRLNRSLKKGTKIEEKFLIYLRPCPKNGLSPYEKNKILGKKLIRNLEKEEIVNCQNTI